MHFFHSLLALIFLTTLTHALPEKTLCNTNDLKLLQHEVTHPIAFCNYYLARFVPEQIAEPL